MAIVGRVLYWITSARLIVAVWLPALAVTVTLLAPVGVPGVLEPPEHAVRTVASGSRRISINRPAIRFLLPISPASTKIPGSISAYAVCERLGRNGAIAAVEPLVLMTSETVDALLTVPKAQFAPAGSPAQLNITADPAGKFKSVKVVEPVAPGPRIEIMSGSAANAAVADAVTVSVVVATLPAV
jgi:hypothetical protein